MAADHETLQVVQEVLRCLCICLAAQQGTHPVLVASALQGYAEGYAKHPAAKAMLLDLAEGLDTFGRGVFPQ